LGILSSSILSRWPSQLILLLLTIFSPLLISSSYFILVFHSLFSYLGPYILLNIFLSKTTLLT
jgi:pilus assembly protein TadC